jgi:hypothetical protein
MFCFKGFFHESFSHKPLQLSLGSFQRFPKSSEDIRKSRFTTCINDTGGIAVVVVTGGKFSEVRDREISSAI